MNKHNFERLIKNGFRFSIDHDYTDNTVGGALASSQGAAQAQGSGAAIDLTAGYVQASDNAQLINAPTTNITMVDPGALSAVQAALADNSAVSGEAILATEELASQAQKSAAELAKQTTKTPIQQLTPFLIVGAVIIVGAIYFLSD